MKNLQKVIVFILMVLIMSVWIFSNINLKEAIDAAIKKDTKTRNLKVDLKISEINIQSAKDQRFFKLTLSSDYLYQSDIMKLDLSNLIGADNNQMGKIELGTRSTFDSSLSMIQPIYTGGKVINNIKLNQAMMDLKVNEIELREIEIAGKVKNTYFQYSILRKNKKILNKSLDTIENHIKKIEIWMKNNLVNKGDFLEAKIRKEEINLEIIDLEEKLNSQKIYFERLTDLDLFKIDDIYQEPGISYEQAVNYSRVHHPFFQGITQQIRMVRLQKRMVKGDYLPQLAGFINAHYGRPGINIFENQWSLYYRFGLNLKLNVFAWNQKKKELNNLDYKIQKLKNEKGRFEKDLLKNLKTLYTKQVYLKNKIEIIQRIIDHSKEELLIKEQLYYEKQIDHLNYIDSLFRIDTFKIKKQGLLVQVELIKVSINNLIFRRV